MFFSSWKCSNSQTLSECYIRTEVRSLWSSRWHLLCRLCWVNIRRDDLMAHTCSMLLEVKITTHLNSDIVSKPTATQCPHKEDKNKNIAVDLSKTNMRVHQRTKMWLRSQSLDSTCECCHCCARLNQKFGGSCVWQWNKAACASVTPPYGFDIIDECLEWKKRVNHPLLGWNQSLLTQFILNIIQNGNNMMRNHKRIGPFKERKHESTIGWMKYLCLTHSTEGTFFSLSACKCRITRVT